MPVNFLTPVVVCDDTFQPGTNFNYCDPTLLLSEIEKVGIGNPQSAPFNDITDAAELMQRISQSALNGDDTIRELTVSGEKTAPTPVNVNATNGRIIRVAKDNGLNLTMDELPDENWNYADYIEQHQIQRLFYFVTQSGKMFYFGNEGILVNIAVTDQFPTGRDSIITILFALTWRSKPGLAQIADYPLASGSSNTVVPNPTASISNQTNNSLRLNRTSPANANATAYIYQLYTDSARTQLAAAPQTIASNGLAYADFTGLVAGATHYGRIVPVPASGYTAGTGGVVSGATTNNQTVKVFMMPANTVTALPSSGDITAGISVTGPVHGPVLVTFPDSAGVPKRPTLAYVTSTGFNPVTVTDVNNISNTSPIGVSTAGATPTSNFFDKIGTVGIYTIVQATSDTDYDNTQVSFTE